MGKICLAIFCFVLGSCGATPSDNDSSTQQIPNRVEYVSLSESSLSNAERAEPVLALPDGKYEGTVCHSNGCTELILRDGKIYAWRHYPHCRSWPADWKAITKGNGRIFVGSRGSRERAERIIKGKPRGSSDKQSDRLAEVFNLRAVDGDIHFDFQSYADDMCKGAVFKKSG